LRRPRVIFAASAAFFCAVTPNASAESRKIVIVADDWCPFNCGDSSRFQGFMIDAMREAFAKSNYQVEYKNLPWADAINSVANGKNDAIVGASLDEAKDLVAAIEPIGENKTCFYTRGDDPFRYNSYQDLLKRRLGVIHGYLYGTALDSYIVRNRHDSNVVQIVSGDKPLLKNIQRLSGRRVDTIVENMAVMNYSTQKFLITGIRLAGCDEPSTLHIAFSPKRPDSQKLADIASQEIKALRKSGRLQDILARYGLKDWK
jgi:polar amino acid transport system substrate-binding protein